MLGRLPSERIFKDSLPIIGRLKRFEGQNGLEGRKVGRLKGLKGWKDWKAERIEGGKDWTVGGIGRLIERLKVLEIERLGRLKGSES